MKIKEKKKRNTTNEKQKSAEKSNTKFKVTKENVQKELWYESYVVQAIFISLLFVKIGYFS